MFQDYRKILSALTFVLLIVHEGRSASGSFVHPYQDSLKLKAGDKPHLVMELEMPGRIFEKIVSSRGEDVEFGKTILRFKGDTISIKDGHLHGQSTLQFERKSYSIDTDKKIKLCKGCEGLGAFYLVSLTMDKNYYHNRLCFDLLRTLGLFQLQYTYTELRINGKTQGIYLILQRPQDWALKDIGSPYIVRRGGSERVVDRERVQKDVSKELKRTYHDQFLSIYKVINDYSGEQLYKKLGELMHLEDYMRWLAFNYIIKCGDYSDELHFYIDPATKRFRIVPWDYDDIFMLYPHEGVKARNSKISPSSLIFSSEDKLDVRIANDPYLYDQYLKHYLAVFEELSAERLENVLMNIYSDLSPLFQSSAIIKALSSDGYLTSPKILRTELNNVYQFFEGQRIALNNRNLPK
jgi:spore coat protein H